MVRAEAVPSSVRSLDGVGDVVVGIGVNVVLLLCSVATAGRWVMMVVAASRER